MKYGTIIATTLHLTVQNHGDQVQFGATIASVVSLTIANWIEYILPESVIAAELEEFQRRYMK